MSNWNLADTKAMLAEAGITVEVLSPEQLAAEFAQNQLGTWQSPEKDEA